VDLDAHAAELVAPAQAADLGLHATWLVWQRQRETLSGLHRKTLDAEVPPALAAATRRLSIRQQQSGRWWRWGGMAASVLCAFGLGWMSHGRLSPVAGTAGALA